MPKRENGKLTFFTPIRVGDLGTDYQIMMVFVFLPHAECSVKKVLARPKLKVVVPRRLFFAAQQRIAITWKPK
jgi:hypothetical protein